MKPNFAVTKITSEASAPKHFSKSAKCFDWDTLGEKHKELVGTGFFGKMVLHYEAGKIVLLRMEQTIKP